MLSAKDKITTFVVVIFLFIKRDSNKEGERQSLSEENSPVNFFADGGNEQSEAKEATASEKSLALCHKNTGLTGGLSQKSPIVFAIGLFAL